MEHNTHRRFPIGRIEKPCHIDGNHVYEIKRNRLHEKGRNRIMTIQILQFSSLEKICFRGL